MITPAKRFLIVADQTPRRDEYEVIDPGACDNNTAHVAARSASRIEPGRRFFICEVVGFHEAIVMPPSFTSFGDPPMKSLPRLVERSEELLS